MVWWQSQILAFLLLVSFDVVNPTHEIQVYSSSMTVNSVISELCKQRLDALVMLSWFRPFIGDLKFRYCSLTFNMHCSCIQEAVTNDSIWGCRFLKSSGTIIYGRAVKQPSKTVVGRESLYSAELESFMMEKFWGYNCKG
jgi:hypothetical protein